MYVSATIIHRTGMHCLYLGTNIYLGSGFYFDRSCQCLTLIWKYNFIWSHLNPLALYLRLISFYLYYRSENTKIILLYFIISMNTKWSTNAVKSLFSSTCHGLETISTECKILQFRCIEINLSCTVHYFDLQ